MIFLKSERELTLMRQACRIVAVTLARLQEAVVPEVTTRELELLALDSIRSQGAQTAFKGYQKFPAHICTSVNEEVVHGIPGARRLREGDIVSIDLGAIWNGFYGDAACTFPVGRISPEAQRLLAVTRQALERAIAVVRPDHRLSDVSHEVQQFVEAHGYSVVRNYVGHGIGRAMHEEPQIPNFGPPGRGPRLRPGMTLAIEPMVNIGGWEVALRPDHWTAVTADGSLSAHFEHTVAVTEGEAEILTAAPV